MSNRITKNMHRIVRRDPFINSISDSISAKIDALDERKNNFVEQISIDSATWALKVYEKELGIKTDATKPAEERRSVIISKLRGSGKVDAAQIKLVADSFTNGDVSVSFDNGILIEFTSVVGTPANMDDLKNALREIIPAHLALLYKLRFILINDIHNKMTIKQLHSTKLDAFASNNKEVK